MASSMTICVLCPNGRRQTVKVSPNTSILEVLEEACRKQGLQPNDYAIRHYTKQLDLSLSVRFANLPNNAQLELCPVTNLRQEGLVTVALQLESGERLTGDFSPSSTISDVITKCLGTKSGATDDKEPSEKEPVCIYMRQRFVGDQIKTTTLRNLGLTGGKAIIRLIYRPLQSFSDQAHIVTPLMKPAPVLSETFCSKKPSSMMDNVVAKKQIKLDESVISSSSMDNVEDMLEDFVDNREYSTIPPEEPMQCETTPDPVVDSTPNINLVSASPRETENMQTEKLNRGMPSAPKELGEIKFLGPRNALLFNLEDVLDIKKDEVPDEFFELTINDARYLMDEYKRLRSEMENEPLLLKCQRESRVSRDLSCYRQTAIRIYFPDHLVLQGTFIADETIQAVQDFVRLYLEDQGLDFYLYITPPKVKLMPDKTLLEMRLVPAAVIYFGCDGPNLSFLRPDLRNQISDPRAAAHSAAECRRKVISESMNQLSDEDVTIPTNESLPVMGSNGTNIAFQSRPPQGKSPAWFKMGKQ